MEKLSYQLANSNSRWHLRRHFSCWLTEMGTEPTRFLHGYPWILGVPNVPILETPQSTNHIHSFVKPNLHFIIVFFGPSVQVLLFGIAFIGFQGQKIQTTIVACWANEHNIYQVSRVSKPSVSPLRCLVRRDSQLMDYDNL